MAPTLTLTTRFSLNGPYSETTTDSVSTTSTINKTFSIELASGTSDNQGDRLYHSRYSISASTTQSIDLKGSLVDDLGNAFTPSKLRGIVVENRASTSGLNVYVGGNANAVPIFGAAADYAIVPPSGLFVHQAPIDGITVTAGTGDIIDIENPSGSTAVTVDVWIWGTSA